MGLSFNYIQGIKIPHPNWDTSESFKIQKTLKEINKIWKKKNTKISANTHNIEKLTIRKVLKGPTYSDKNKKISNWFL